MKRIFLILLLLAPFFASAQTVIKTLASKVTDTTAYTVPSGYGALRYKNQGGYTKWQYTNNGTTWLDFGSGGGFTLSNGNGTTANGSAVDLGGTTNSNVTVTGEYDQTYERSDSFIVPGPSWNAIDLIRHKIQSGGFKLDASLSNDGGFLGTRTAKLELSNPVNVTSTSSYYTWVMNTVDYNGTTTSLELDPYYFKIKKGSDNYIDLDFTNNIFSFKKPSGDGFYFNNSSVFLGLGAGSEKFGYDATGSFINLGSDATGDTYYRNSSGYFTRLAAGTNGHVLTLAGGIPSWAAPAAGGLTVGTSTITSGTNTRVLYNNSGVLGEYTVSGSGNVAMTTSPVFTTPNIGTATGTASGNWFGTGITTFTGAVDIVGSSSNTLKHTFNSLGTTQTNGAGLWFTNTTAAAAGAQQISPSIVLEGQGWKTNATSASQSVKFAEYVLPVQGAANPTAELGWYSSINGGAYTRRMYINDAGTFVVGSSSLDANGSLTLGTNRIIVFNGGLGTIGADTNTGLAFRANASSTVPTGGYYRFYNTNGNYTATSGTLNIMANETSFAPTSGTAVFNAFLGSGTINQTGGANGNVSMIALTPTFTAAGGDVYGFRYNPTVTSISGTHYSFQASSGNMVVGGATISTSGVFGFNNTTKEIKLNGMRIWTDHDTNSKDNHFIGYNAGNTSLTGIDNLGFGPGVLTDVTTGSDNIAVGNLAGNDLQDGSNNVLLGRVAGNALVSGNANVMVGYGAGELTTGSNNIFIGNSAGNANTSGAANVVIGVDIDAQSNTASNQLTLQNAIFGSANSSSGTTVSSGNIGFYATTWGTSAARVLSLGNGTAPSTSITDGVQIYAEDVAASSELKVRDEAGNVTTISPHNFTLTKPSEAGAWSHYSEYTNPETGEREAVNVDMLKLARLIEQLTGEKLVYKTTLKK